MIGRGATAIGGVLGFVWAIAVVVLPGQVPWDFIPFNLALSYAFAPGGLVVFFILLRVALRSADVDRVVDQDVDRAVLIDTGAIMLVALLMWPLVITFLDSVTVIAMGLSAGVALLVYWIGAHWAAPLRAFGWAASFWPTGVAVVWVIWRLVT